MFNLSKITVAILAGGLGIRLAPILPGQQKVVAGVRGHPFLEYILNQLDKAGFKKVVLCTGYLGDQVEEVLKEKFKDLSIIYSKENSQLGTAGALKHATLLLKSDLVLVMNGDSYCEIELEKFVKFHFEKRSSANIALSYVSNTSRYGSVILSKEDKIIGFEEKKEGGGKGWINGGIYLINRSLISSFPLKTPLSLEKDVFPGWVGKSFFGYKTKSSFLDIGTPQSYKKAGKFFMKINTNKKRFVLIDRDGTLIKHYTYLSNPDQVEFIPGAINALKEFKKIGLGIVVITNQSGIGRGYFNLATLDKIHKRLTDLLVNEGIVLDDIYFCPHTPEDDCLCRKPKVQLVEQAAKKHHFDPRSSFIIGDNKSDIELGEKIGASTILVRKDHGEQVKEERNIKAEIVVDSLEESLFFIKEKLKTS